jgi:hypothetical protein
MCRLEIINILHYNMKNKQLLENIKTIKKRLNVLSEEIERDPSFNFFDKVRELEAIIQNISKEFIDGQLLQLYIWRKLGYRFLYSGGMPKQEGENLFMEILNNLKKFEEIYPNEKLGSEDSYDVMNDESKKYPLKGLRDKISTFAKQKATELGIDLSPPKEE